MQPERDRGARPTLILITDGRPDEDFRGEGCDCADPGSAEGCPPDVDAAAMHCPYPRAELAARALRCGDSVDCAEPSGPAAQVFVIGLSIGDVATRAQLDAIARSGGQASAAMARDAQQLRTQLRAILQQIHAGAASASGG